MFANIDVTNFPPAELLPKNVADAIAERDAAFDALDNFETEYSEFLTDRWEAIFEAHDIAAAADAVAAGKSLDKVRSTLAEARDRRPTIIGAHRALSSKLREAENAAQKAFRPVAGTLEPAALDRLHSAATEAENAYREYLSARERFGAATAVVRFTRAWQNGERPDFNDEPQNPLTAQDNHPDHAEPLGQIREVMDSYGVPFTADPLVLVRSKVNGTILELKRSQAEALVGNANDNSAEIIEESAV